MAKSLSSTSKTPIKKAAPKKMPKTVAKPTKKSRSKSSERPQTSKSPESRPQAFFSNEDREQMIRYAAYHIAEKDGFRPGHEENYWYQAEQQINDLFQGRMAESAKPH